MRALQLFALLALLAVMPARAQIFVSNYSSDSIGEYNTNTGALINNIALGFNPDSLVADGNLIYIGGPTTNYLDSYNLTTGALTGHAVSLTSTAQPSNLALLNSILYATSYYGGDVLKVTSSTSPVVTGLNTPTGITASANDLYVAVYGSNAINEYNSAGGLVQANIVTGLSGPEGLAVYGNDLYVANSSNGTVGEYTLTGAVVNASLVSGLAGPNGISVVNGVLYVTTNNNLAEYDATSGALINSSLVSGLGNPDEIVVLPMALSTPEPRSWAFAASVMALMGGLLRRRLLVA